MYNVLINYHTAKNQKPKNQKTKKTKKRREEKKTKPSKKPTFYKSDYRIIGLSDYHDFRFSDLWIYRLSIVDCRMSMTHSSEEHEEGENRKAKNEKRFLSVCSSLTPSRRLIRRRASISPVLAMA